MCGGLEPRLFTGLNEVVIAKKSWQWCIAGARGVGEGGDFQANSRIGGSSCTIYYAAAARALRTVRTHLRTRLDKNDSASREKEKGQTLVRGVHCDLLAKGVQVNVEHFNTKLCAE